MPAPAALLTRLMHQAQSRPDHIAFLDGGKATAYAGLWREVLQWRAALLGRIAPGDRVAVLADNSAQSAAACHGIWAAHGVWVGLNTSLKQEDLLWQMKQCGARLLITTSKFGAIAQAAIAEGIQVWQPGQDGPQAMGEGALGSPAVEPADADLDTALDRALDTMATTPIEAGALDTPAAIIYTSGTTGMPKGVVLTHANLAANVDAILHSLPIRPDDVALCLLPFFYAYGCSVLHTHLSVGATLVLEHSLMYPQKVLQRMADTRVTAFYGVPSSYYLLMERGHLANTSLPSLRYGAQAGGAMEAARIEEVCQALPGIGFYVMYGQTEASSRLTTLPDGMRQRKPGSAGCAVKGVTLSIQTEDGATLPTGQIGEVCAQGLNVMQGYWQAPEDTAKALRGGWLRTGDLGYLDEDGFLFLTGRSREQIKTGAHRVSPWEIEQLIQSVSGVREAAVVGQPDHLLGEIAHAYVIADDPSDMLRRAIMLACKTRLAAYKMPRHVSFVADFPRTASGKVRKHLLAAMPPSPPSSLTTPGTAS